MKKLFAILAALIPAAQSVTARAQGVEATAASIYRDYVTPWNAASGVYNPPKVHVRNLWMTQLGLNYGIPASHLAPNAAAQNLGATVPAFSDAVAARPNLGLDGFVTPQMYDSLCGVGTHDCTAAIASAVATGKEIYLPCASYFVTQIVMVGSGKRIRGAGPCSKIWGTLPANDIIQLGDGNAAHSNNLSLSNLRVWTTQNRGAGAAINVNGAPRTWLDRIEIGSYEDQAANGSWLFDGLNVNNSPLTFVSRTMFVGSHGAGIRVIDTTNFQVDSQSWMTSCSNGVIQGGGSNVYLDMNILGCSGYGVWVTGSNNNQLFLGPFFASDSNVGDALHVDPSAFAAGTQLYCTGCWLANSSAGYGAWIDTGNQIVARFEGAHIGWNRSTGLYTKNASGTLIVNGSSIYNNGNTTAAGHGIQYDNLAGAAVITSNNYIATNGIGINSGWGAISTGTAGQHVFTGNALIGNASGSMSLPAVSATVICANNLKSNTGTC